MPSGQVVYYRDGDDEPEQMRHTYWRSYVDGKVSGRVAGATTVAKNDGKPNVDGLVQWACNLAKDGKDWREERDASAEVGNAAHAVLQTLAEDNLVPPFTDGHQMAVISWFKATRPDPILIESVVYDHERDVAGTPDLLFNPDNPTLIDLKTGSVRNAALVQVNLYKLALRVAGYPVPERLLILDTRADGSWQELEVPVNANWALDALRCHRNGQDMRRALTQARKSATTGQAQTQLQEAA